MFNDKLSRVEQALEIALVLGGASLLIWERWHQNVKSVPAYFLGIPILLAMWGIRSAYIAYRRRLLAQLVVSSCALAVLPSLLIAPRPLSTGAFWIATVSSGLLNIMAEAPLHLLDMISAPLVVPCIWLECSSLAKDGDTRVFFHFFLFVAALPLLYRYLLWRLKYGIAFPDPEDE